MQYSDHQFKNGLIRIQQKAIENQVSLNAVLMHKGLVTIVFSIVGAMSILSMTGGRDWYFLSIFIKTF